MANMSAKFDQEAHNSLVAIVFTSLFPYMSIVTLTFDLKNWYGPSSHHGQQLCHFWSRNTEQFVSIVFTSWFPYMSIVTLTFDLHNQ